MPDRTNGCRCRGCEQEFDTRNNDGRDWQTYQKSLYCSQVCKDASDRAYDSYVDPMGFYQSKVGDPYE